MPAHGGQQPGLWQAGELAIQLVEPRRERAQAGRQLRLAGRDAAFQVAGQRRRRLLIEKPGGKGVVGQVVAPDAAQSGDQVVERRGHAGVHRLDLFGQEGAAREDRLDQAGEVAGQSVLRCVDPRERRAAVAVGRLPAGGGQGGAEVAELLVDGGAVRVIRGQQEGAQVAFQAGQVLFQAHHPVQRAGGVGIGLEAGVEAAQGGQPDAGDQEQQKQQRGIAAADAVDNAQPLASAAGGLQGDHAECLHFCASHGKHLPQKVNAFLIGNLNA